MLLQFMIHTVKIKACTQAYLFTEVYISVNNEILFLFFSYVQITAGAYTAKVFQHLIIHL